MLFRYEGGVEWKVTSISHDPLFESEIMNREAAENWMRNREVPEDFIERIMSETSEGYVVT